MPELTGQPASAAPAAEPAAPAITPAPEVEGFVNVDGTFTEGWQGRLKNEALRTDETLGRFNKFEDLANSYVNVRKQIPMENVVLPTETSPSEIWDEFHRRTGRPDTAEEYVIERPEGIPEEHWSDELVKGAKELFHKIGLNPNHVKALTEFDNQRVIANMQQVADAEAKAKSDAETALKQKWGVDYDSRLHLANRMVSENTEEGETRQKVLEKIGNDPIVADFLANMASKFLEHGVITTDVEIPSSNDLAEINKKISEICEKEGFNVETHPDHKFLVEQYKKLHEQKYNLKKKLQTTR